MFSRITSFRFSGIKGNTGQGLGVTGQISSKSEANWVSSSAVQGTDVCGLCPPRLKYVQQCAPVIRNPQNPSRWERGQLLLGWGREWASQKP